MDSLSTPSASNESFEQSLATDPSFWGLMICQFLGAFNDNVVKQLVLLSCIVTAGEVAGQKDTGTDLQGLAVAILRQTG